MKVIRLQITDELHTRLKSLCNHHGRQAHLLRRGVRLICEEEEAKLGKDSDVEKSNIIQQIADTVRRI